MGSEELHAEAGYHCLSIEASWVLTLPYFQWGVRNRETSSTLTHTQPKMQGICCPMRQNSVGNGGLILSPFFILSPLGKTILKCILNNLEDNLKDKAIHCIWQRPAVPRILIPALSHLLPCCPFSNSISEKRTSGNGAAFWGTCTMTLTSKASAEILRSRRAACNILEHIFPGLSEIIAVY